MFGLATLFEPVVRAGRAAASVLVMVIWANATVAQECDRPQALTGLVLTLSILPADGTEVSPRIAERISDQMSGLSEQRLLNTLNDTHFEALEGIALDLMAEGARLSSAGARYDPRHMQSMLREFDRQSELACARAKDHDIGVLPEARWAIITDGRIDWQALDRVLKDSILATGGAVVVALILVIGLLFAFDIAARWIWTLLYNRRACCVPAVLEIDGKGVPGLMLTLGRGGFRFQPRDASEIPLVVGCDAVLNVSGTALPGAKLARFHQTMGDFKLAEPMSVEEQNEILALSTIPPRFIRKRRGGGEAQLAQLVTDDDTGKESDSEGSDAQAVFISVRAPSAAR
ncbi:hypothetical protein J4E08_02365 [Sagittula sp. NFXS13]|uniref:hypothetical protein n=1 Tax=Sagittula sp. NFXS13 TaxID=2819095 RepID=UPI0032DED7F7